MVGVSVVVLVLGLNGHLGRIEGLLLTLGLAAYIGFAIYESRKGVETGLVEAEYTDEFGDSDRTRGGLLMDIGMVGGGLALLVLGSNWLVDAAKEVALDLGLSDLIVGLTIVAAGTSLPEVATSSMAALKGERDIAVGNVVGSNIFNLLGVLGLSSLLSPDAIAVSDSAVRFDLRVMVAVAIACMPVFFTGLIARWQGLLFLAFYVAYVGYMVLDASEHGALGTYSNVMLLFVLPLSGLALLGGFARHQLRERAAEREESRIA